VVCAEPLRLSWRPYRFQLPRAWVTSQGAWRERCGWLLRLETAAGRIGWGEAAALPQAGSAPDLAAAIATLPARMQRGALEQLLPQLASPLACALGLALAECDGLGAPHAGGWRPAPPSAWLLPAGEAAIGALEALLASPAVLAATPTPTLKWKVATAPDTLERRLLESILERLPSGSRLRLDANGGWDRATAAAWVERLQAEPRLEWLEQPLPPHDQAGLRALAARLPLALDESLRAGPASPGAPPDWRGWQVRRPLAEGDPRPLLAALQAGRPRLMLSTALETGIGRRLVAHLAALQHDGPTPTAPGLAPGWCPAGELFAADPALVWAAAA